MESKTKMADVRDEIKCFVEGTSLKGAPRIIKSPRLFMRVFWIIIVLFLLTMTLFLTVRLVQDFLSYGVVITLSEYIMLSTSDRAHLEKEYHFSFPAVTVCNNNPFRSDYTDYLPEGVLAEGQFTDIAGGQLRRLNYSEHEKLDFTSFGYLAYLFDENAQLNRTMGDYHTKILGQPIQDFFIRCFFTSNDNKANDDLACRTMARVDQRFLTYSLTCYRIEFIGNNNVHRNSITALTMVLYLDNFSQHIMRGPFDFVDDFRKQTGVVVITHLPNTYPQIFDAYSTFAPGQNVVLNVRTNAIKRLPLPYSDCDEEGKPLYGFFEDFERNPYSQKGCIMACERAAIKKKCGCKYLPRYLFFDKDDFMRSIRLPKCHSYDLVNMTLTMDRIRCAQETISEVQQDCLNRCKPNCTEIQFTHASTATKWPAKNAQLSFYKTVMNPPFVDPNTPRREKFAPIFEPINDAYLAGNTTEALRMLDSTELIDDNFVKITVKLDKNNVVAFESSPKIDANQFMSLLGGTLNLYAGITFVLLFELVELFIKICFKIVNKQTNQNVYPEYAKSTKERKL